MQPKALPVKGTVFFRPLFKDFLHIYKIETHKIEDRKKVKLKDSIYHIEYLLNCKPPFTTYEKDVLQMISFKRWIISHEIKS